MEKALFFVAMSKKFAGVLAGLSLMCSVASTAQAVTIFDNGNPNTVNGRNLRNFVAADDFSFANQTTVNGAEIFLTSSISEAQWNTNGFETAYTYFLFDDNAGLPGSILDSGQVVNAAVSTSPLPSVLSFTLLLTFDFDSAFTATAGDSFWLGLSTGNTFTNTFWAQTNSSTGASGQQASDNDLEPPFAFLDIATDYAFRLTAEPELPEPGALALFGIGLAGLALASKRRKTGLKL